jgi:hypothetical protein
MRVLIDECVPQSLRTGIAGHDAFTVGFMGWAGKKNGELIALMKAGGFEALVTVDRSLPRQQHIAGAGIAVVVMVAPSNAVSSLSRLLPSVNSVLSRIRPGQVIEVDR